MLLCVILTQTMTLELNCLNNCQVFLYNHLQLHISILVVNYANLLGLYNQFYWWYWSSQTSPALFAAFVLSVCRGQIGSNWLTELVMFENSCRAGKFDWIYLMSHYSQGHAGPLDSTHGTQLATTKRVSSERAFKLEVEWFEVKQLFLRNNRPGDTE